MAKKINRELMLYFMKSTISCFSFLLAHVDVRKMSDGDLDRVAKLRFTYERLEDVFEDY